MKFSSRLNWSLTPNPLTQLLEAKRARGIPILDLTESNPTRCGFHYDAAAIRGATPYSQSLTYAPSPRGLLSAREAITNYYSSKSVIPSPEGARNLSDSPRDFSSRSALLGMTNACDPNSIFLTASTSEAYSFLFKLLGNAGDEILVPQPSYPLFEFLAGLESLSTVHYPLSYYNSWQINFEVLRESISEKTKAIVIVNPNNPTGNYLKKDELAKLNELCGERNIALIVDEVFSDYAHGEDANRVETVVGNEGALTFALSGLSKVVALPQMKLGWIQVSGERTLVEESAARLELIADTYLSVGTPVQHAAPKLLETRGEIQREIKERVEMNGKVLDGLKLNVLKREGGWYAVIEVEQDDEKLAYELLERENVLAHPGYFYDFTGRKVMVVSLITRREVFEEGVLRLKNNITLPKVLEPLGG
jgi:aspartate/methionine/tyrosine aminotransferase